MALARDANSSGENGGITQSLTVSQTCTGSNGILWVSVSVNGTASDVLSAATAVQYNAVNMSRVGFAPVAGLGEYLYVLVNPSTGAHNIVVSISGGTNRDIRLTASSYTGAAQSGVPDSSNTGTAGNPSSSPLTVATTVVASNCWLVGGTFDDTFALAAGTGTNLVVASAGGGGTFNKFWDSNATVGTGSQSLQVTWSGTVHDTGMCVASMAPVANATHNLPLIGIGT